MLFFPDSGRITWQHSSTIAMYERVPIFMVNMEIKLTLECMEEGENLAC